MENNYTDYLDNMTVLSWDTILEHIRDFRSMHSIGGSASLILTIMYVPIFIVSVFGNISAIFILSRRTAAPRFTKNLYLVNLVLADLSVSLICVPMAVGQALHRVWIFGEFLCKGTAYLQGVTVSASIYTIAILSIDRLLAIRHPILFRRVSNTKNAIKLIVAIWLVSVGIMSPLLFMRRVDIISVLPGHTLYICTEIWPRDSHRQTYDILLFVILYFIPGIIICCSYGLIGKELWTEDEHLQHKESEMGRHIGKQVMNSRKKLAKMFIALAILFALCWLPYHIISVYLDFCTEGIKPFLTILPFAILLGHTNSALNPILYFYSCKSFRKYLFRLLQCPKGRSRKNVAVKYTPPKRECNTKSRPRVRLLSSNTFTRTKSSGDSFRFSRSTNTSLKSTNITIRSRDSSPRDKRYKFRIAFDYRSLNFSGTADDNKYQTIKALVYAHKKEILDRTLSIPTTINEESSRKESLTIARPQISQPFISRILEEIED